MRRNPRHAQWALLTTTLLAACGGEEHVDARRQKARGGTVVHISSVNLCPVITMMLVAPLRTSVGYPIDLVAEASDPDGDFVVPWWDSSQGTIAEPDENETSYLCEAPGQRTITFTVLDDGGCEQRLSTPVTCE